jgi:hypothetical protein
MPNGPVLWRKRHKKFERAFPCLRQQRRQPSDKRISRNSGPRTPTSRVRPADTRKQKEGLRLAETMRHVEAVIKMLDHPTFNLRPIAVKQFVPADS